MKKFLLLSLLIIGYWLLTIPSVVHAACWCSDPKACTCANSKTTPYSTTRQVGIDKATKATLSTTIYCDSQAEVDSEFRQVMPVCGSSPEILPFCAYRQDPSLPDGIDTSEVTCYGREFFKGKINIPDSIPQNKLSNMKGPVVMTYTNGTTQSFGSGDIKIFWCNSIAFCCARSDIKCSNEGVPAFGPSDYCTPNLPQDPAFQKSSMCTAPSGQGESRIFIPHLKNISALATLLQTMFNPFPSLFSNNTAPVPGGKTASSSVTAQDTVTSKIYFHQGLDDNTQYVDSSNNSSLKVNSSAPAPLYNFDNSSFYKQDGLCRITDTKYNPGDDLLGPKIVSNLIYTQKYTYPALAKAPGCTTDNDTTTNPDSCCSKTSSVIDTVAGRSLYKCGTAPAYKEKTQGQIAVFTKTPLVEYIYNVLVTGSQSVFKRMMPQNLPKEFKEIPGQANYSVSSNGESLAAGGVSGGTPTLYFPHVGSLKEYFLDGIQKALRPASATVPQSGTNSSSGNKLTCTLPMDACPAVNWGSATIDAYAKAYNSDTNDSWSLVKEPFAQTLINNTADWTCPRFVATIWLEESGGSAIGSADLGCLVYLDGRKALSSDHQGGPSNFSSYADFANHYKPILQDQINCLKSYVTAIKPDFSTFMCQYSGEADTDPTKPFRQCSTFTANPNWPVNVCRIGTTEMNIGASL